MSYAEETIEFVLSHFTAIRIAVNEQRLESCGNGGHTGGNGTGHMRVSDPTAIQAIRAISALPYVEIPFGPIVAGRRETWELKRPEKWLSVVEAVSDYYLHNERMKAFYESRYINNDDWHRTCKKLNLTRASYYAMRADVLHMAELYAVQYGVLAPCWHGLKLT